MLGASWNMAKRCSSIYNQKSFVQNIYITLKNQPPLSISQGSFVMNFHNNIKTSRRLKACKNPPNHFPSLDPEAFYRVQLVSHDLLWPIVIQRLYGASGGLTNSRVACSTLLWPEGGSGEMAAESASPVMVWGSGCFHFSPNSPVNKTWENVMQLIVHTIIISATVQ